MNTDQQILELVKTGKFTLPPGVEIEDDQLVESASGFFPEKAEERQRIHDLCACHSAREMDADSATIELGLAIKWSDAMAIGDSVAAIAALYEAVCGKGACAGDSETGRLNKEQS